MEWLLWLLECEERWVGEEWLENVALGLVGEPFGSRCADSTSSTC